MLSSESLASWLAYSAVVNLVVLSLFGGAVLLCRQPARRLWLIELSLAGCLVVPWLQIIPGYPRLAVGWRRAAPPERHETLTLRTAAEVVEPMASQDDAALPVVSDPPPKVFAAAAATPAAAWNLASWIIALYLFGVAMGVAWWLLGVAALLRIIRTARPAPLRCRRLLAEIAGRRSEHVRLLASRWASQPLAAAWWPAVIVLPENLCDDEQAVRWALAHEWTHVERHDFRMWFVAGLARVLFFYQPLVWWLRRQLRLCQDFVADARAARQSPQAEDYAEFLTVRAAAGSLHPAMAGLGMGFRKSELYRRVVMLVENPPLESRAPRLWTISVTCAALVLLAAVGALSIAPQAAAQGESAAQREAIAAAADPTPPGAIKPFTAVLPCGVVVELRGVSKHPSSETSWWRPDGSPLAERPCDPLKGSADGGPDHVAREFAVQLHNLPGEPVGTEVLFDPPYNAYCGGAPKCFGKKVAGLECMTVSVPNQRTVTVRVRVAAGSWQTVCETARGNMSTGTMKGAFAFSAIDEKDGTVSVTVTHNIVGLESRVVAVGRDGRERRASLSSGGGAGTFVQITAAFAKLSRKDIKVFRVQTRPYEQVEFRNVSLRPGQKTDVQVMAAKPVRSARVSDAVQRPAAAKEVTSYHARFSQGGMSDVWVQLNPDGTPLRARIDYPQTEDGAKAVICSAGQAAVWFKDKKGYNVFPEKDALSRVVAMRNICDPTLAFKALQARMKAGQVTIETKEPAKDGDFLTLTVTPKDTPNRRELYEVNPKTKLAERVTYSVRQGGQWKQVKLIEHLGHDKPIDPKVFDLDLPEDVVKVDSIKRPPGLVNGGLTKEQMATKVAREFFEALIAKDYDKAGLIFSGIPAERMKADFGRLNALRIVEIGAPTLGQHPDPTAFAVPVKVECGPRKWVQEYAPQVRLTDSAAATTAAREFVEAIIRQDDAAARRALDAGLVFEGFSGKNADKLKEFFEQYKILRIVKVGKPAPYPETNRLEVPVKVELEMKNERIQEFNPFIRPEHYGQSERWVICGGL